MNPKTAQATSTALRKEMKPSMDLLSLLILSTTWSMLRREEEDEEEAAEAEAGGEVLTSWLKKGKAKMSQGP